MKEIDIDILIEQQEPEAKQRIWNRIASQILGSDYQLNDGSDNDLNKDSTANQDMGQKKP